MGRKLIFRTPTEIDLEKPITIKMLASHLGLSIAAVSRVLNESPAARSIPVETRDRIFAAAKTLNYTPNIFARSLRSRRSYTVGVIVSEVSEGYATLVLSGIEQKLMDEGYFYFVVSHHQRPELLAQYESLLMARGVDGVVAVDTALHHKFAVPTVTVSGHNEPEGVSNILLDHRRAASLAIGHLHNLGHTRIALMRGQAHASDTEERWSAIVNRMHGFKLEVDPRLIVTLEEDDPTAEPAYRATKRLLESGVPFTALFAYNDISAIGSMRAIAEVGLRIPDDISVIGFDDIQTAAYLVPGLTTIRQPLKEMGRLAAERLLALIRTPDDPFNLVRQLVVDPELVVRGSTCAPSTLALSAKRA